MQTFSYNAADDILKDFDIYAKDFTHISMHVFGRVQGVGFRPYVYNLANALDLCGYVQNMSNCVAIIFAYNPHIKEFISKLFYAKDSNIHIESVCVNYYTDSSYYDKFIIASSVVSRQSAIKLQLPLDYKICDSCINDMRNKDSRFYNYAFVSCLNCGTRYSILHNLPYHRDNTSMSNFCMCSHCIKDYTDTSNRRFHAEQISCNDCRINIHAYRFYNNHTESIGNNDNALALLAEALMRDEVVIYKGLGGFAYLANAKSDRAVKKLRSLKQRPYKPLVIMAHIDRLKTLATLDDSILELLDSKESPIALTYKSASYDLCKEVSFSNTIGIMIPYTPMLILLFAILGKDAVICYTSANKKGDMIANDISMLDRNEILSILSADISYKEDSILVLDYDREIVHRLDDSIVSCLCDDDYNDCAIASCINIIDNRFRTIRISRGFSPMNLTFKNLSLKSPSMSFGAMQKSSISFGIDNSIAVSSYMGDLFSMNNIMHYRNYIDFFISLYGKPEYLAIDSHPQYESSKIALELADTFIDSKVINVYHHHAHMNALLLESNMDYGLGIIFDGSGFGMDNSIWGGEFLSGNFGNVNRELHFKPFRILGNNVKDAKRLLLSYALCNNLTKILEYIESSYDKEQLHMLKVMHARALNSPFTSSVGRIFDIAAFILGLSEISYEEQSGELIAYFAHKALESTTNLYFNPYPFYIDNGQIDICHCIESMFCDIQNGISKESIALRFIDTLAFCILDGIRKIGADKALFGGGVFGNYVLCNRIRQLLSSHNIKFFFPKLPCNDYSISIGQLAALSAL